MEPVFVFVYGTLKRGYGNNRLLQHSSSFVGEAVTCEPFKMVGNGFPYINRANDCVLPVLGEVWKVVDEDTLQRLDWLEGVASRHYIRSIIDVQLIDGYTLTVNTYLSGHSLEEYEFDGRLIYIDEKGNRMFRWERWNG